ncbi:hypothetical protein N4G70_36780 [Streptomyces sp. ASQP_92]|uniref:hypothetical protein n=1 Tax=Streptomyces sp. ASQP_92 TaxID=2979116 RepID=UPI0021BFA0DE|nr:hypothetical protein [Streptomyces sp. ASQP_92]MCT9094349.1 hypothetical protein [Streptomyces sp. ASQP_92]
MNTLRMGAKATALAVLALPLLGSTAYAAPQAETSAAASSAAAVHTSWGCDNNPRVNRFNTSYTPGNNTVTVYYNNHCNHSVKYRVEFFDTKNQENHMSACVTAPAGKKSSKKFDKSVFDNVTGVWKC